MTTVEEQISMMEHLKQKPAAWLAGISPRSLRDALSVRRNADGTYDARFILQWAAARVPEQANLSDVDLERLLVLAAMISVRTDQQQAAAVELLDGLRAKYGDGALVCFVDLLMEEWRAGVELEDNLAVDPEYERRQAEHARRMEEEQQAVDELRICVQCDCGRVRRGRRWVQAVPPAGHKVIVDICPSCND